MSPELERRIQILADKRDYSADALNKPMLALSYQLEIDKLIKEHESDRSRPPALPRLSRPDQRPGEAGHTGD